MTEPFWRPANFIVAAADGLGAGDTSYTVNPGDIAVVTSIFGSCFGDGSTTAVFTLEYVTGTETVDVWTQSVFASGPAPIAVLNPWLVVLPGETLSLIGTGGSINTCDIVVSGRLYAATQLAP